MTKPYNKGEIWYIKLKNGWETEFTSYDEAWEYYEAHIDDDEEEN